MKTCQVCGFEVPAETHTCALCGEASFVAASPSPLEPPAPAPPMKPTQNQPKRGR